MDNNHVIPSFEDVPTELKNRKQWVNWRLERFVGKVEKVPYRPNMKPALINNTDHYSTFRECVNALRKGTFSGIGFVFTRTDPYCILDLDGALDSNGEPFEWAYEIYSALQCSYKEYSVMGRGLHFIVKGFHPHLETGLFRFIRPDGGSIEFRDRDCFYAITGELFVPNYDGIEDCQVQLDSLFDKYHQKPFRTSDRPIELPMPSIKPVLTR